MMRGEDNMKEAIKMLMVFVIVIGFLPVIAGIGQSQPAGAPASDPFGLIVIVYDEDGNAVPNAIVDVLDVNTGVNKTYMTDANGYLSVVINYELNANDGDTIKVSASKDGKVATEQFTIDTTKDGTTLIMTLKEPAEEEGRALTEATYFGISVINWVLIIIILGVIAVIGYLAYKKKKMF